jgi:predicted LPLAT superfamily acyltransferase
LHDAFERMTPSTTSHWASLSERGGALGIRIVSACFRLLGERAARMLLYPVVAYFLLTGSSARRASHDYFTRLRRFAGAGAATPAPGWSSGFRHMMAFAESGLHKFAAWLGQVDPASVDFPNRPELEALLSTGKGALLIGAHLGNLEMTRALAAGERIARVNAVVYAEHAPAFFSALAAANPDFSVNLIHVTEVGPATSIALREKIDRGELVVIVGDRTPPGESGRTCEVDFLGAPARFAQGPFILASLLECPVYLFFCLKEADGYRIHLERFAEKVTLPRAEREPRLRELVQRYAARLETYCVRAPYQWFNFYNYWLA